MRTRTWFYIVTCSLLPPNNLGLFLFALVSRLFLGFEGAAYLLPGRITKLLKLATSFLSRDSSALLRYPLFHKGEVYLCCLARRPDIWKP
jgi:hypothetical protein